MFSNVTYIGVGRTSDMRVRIMGSVIRSVFFCCCFFLFFEEG